MRIFSGWFLAVLFAAAPASADELWKTDPRQLNREAGDIDGAIFRADLPGGPLVRLHVGDLAAGGAPRGNFSGYWISTDEQTMCAAEMIGPLGARRRTCGRMSLAFVSKSFPSDLTALAGERLDDPVEVLTGIAVTGSQPRHHQDTSRQGST